MVNRREENPMTKPKTVLKKVMMSSEKNCQNCSRHDVNCPIENPLVGCIEFRPKEPEKNCENCKWVRLKNQDNIYCTYPTYSCVDKEFWQPKEPEKKWCCEPMSKSIKNGIIFISQSIGNDKHYSWSSGELSFKITSDCPFCGTKLNPQEEPNLISQVVWVNKYKDKLYINGEEIKFKEDEWKHICIVLDSNGKNINDIKITNETINPEPPKKDKLVGELGIPEPLAEEIQ